jgi:transposase-like protein
MVFKSGRAPDKKVRIVIESLNTNITAAEPCRKYGGRPPSFYAWREKFFRGGKLALSGQIKNPVKEMEAKNEIILHNINCKNVLPNLGLFLDTFLIWYNHLRRHH